MRTPVQIRTAAEASTIQSESRVRVFIDSESYDPEIVYEMWRLRGSAGRVNGIGTGGLIE
jgi:hypothetical protein